MLALWHRLAFQGHTPTSLLGIHVWSQPKMHSLGIGNSLNQLSKYLENVKLSYLRGFLKVL